MSAVLRTAWAWLPWGVLASAFVQSVWGNPERLRDLSWWLVSFAIWLPAYVLWFAFGDWLRRVLGEKEQGQ